MRSAGSWWELRVRRCRSRRAVRADGPDQLRDLADRHRPALGRAGLEAVLRSLDDEARRPSDERTADLQRHLLCTLLLWIDRWHEDAAPRETDNGDARLHVRFVRQLEHDYVRHHDAAYYADTLAVPTTTLAHALHAITGHTTKELILDRVMLEAARLLRFTDLAISQIAYRCGYNDPLYFSRAFKRHQGQSPANLGAYCGA